MATKKRTEKAPIQAPINGRTERSAIPQASVDAMESRAAWMRELGLSEDEIREYCDPAKYPPTAEQENLDALRKLRAMGEFKPF